MRGLEAGNLQIIGHEELCSQFDVKSSDARKAVNLLLSKVLGG